MNYYNQILDNKIIKINKKINKNKIIKIKEY